LLQPGVVNFFDLREAPHLRDEYSLLSWEFVFASSESLDCNFDVLFLAPDGEKWLADGDSGCPFDGFPVSPSHSGLEPIGPRTREHLVDADYVPRVHSTSHVKSVFSCVFGQILVGCDTRCFQGV